MWAFNSSGSVSVMVFIPPSGRVRRARRRRSRTRRACGRARADVGSTMPVDAVRVVVHRGQPPPVRSARGSVEFRPHRRPQGRGERRRCAAGRRTGELSLVGDGRLSRGQGLADRSSVITSGGLANSHCPQAGQDPPLHQGRATSRRRPATTDRERHQLGPRPRSWTSSSVENRPDRADVTDARMPFLQPEEAGPEDLTHLGGPFDQPVALVDGEHGAGGGQADRVALVGQAGADGMPSTAVATSAETMHAPSGTYPLVIPLAIVMMSGDTPSWSTRTSGRSGRTPTSPRRR